MGVACLCSPQLEQANGGQSTHFCVAGLNSWQGGVLLGETVSWQLVFSPQGFLTTWRWAPVGGRSQ